MEQIVSAGMFVQGGAGPLETPGFYSVGYGGISAGVAENTQAFLKGHSGCCVERCLEGSSRRGRRPTGQPQAQEAELVKA